MKSLYYIVILLAIFLPQGSCANQKRNIYPLSDAYPKQHELASKINRICSINPDLAKHKIIGFSGTEELPIYCIEMGKGKRNILIIGQHHGDEVLGVALSLHIAETFLRAYPSTKSIRNILEEYKFWILPSINPEGWRIVSSGLLQYKRKNNRDTNNNNSLDLRTDGVDLNRNYPVFWDIDPDTNILSPYYKGSAPASEPEVQAVIALARKVSFDMGIFYHSSASGAFSEKIYLPAVVEQSERFLALEHIGDFYAKHLPRDYYQGTYTLHRGVSSRVGNARNFFYHSLNVPAMLVEIGGVNKQGRSIIHPDSKVLEKILKRHEKALIKMLLESSLWN